MRRLRVLLVLIPALCTGLLAQPRSAPPSFPADDAEGIVVSPNPAIRTAWKRKVFWKISVSPAVMANRTIPAQTAAERQEMNATLDSLVSLLKATPTGSDGQGFWVLESRTLDYFDLYALPQSVPTARHPLQHESRLFPFYHSDVRQADGSWKMSVNGETESVGFSVNWLPGRMNQQVIATEAGTGGRSDVELYLRPRVTARFAGLPLYEQDLLVVSRAGRDLWSTVSYGRALKAALPLFEKDKKTAEQRLAGLKSKNDEVQSAAWEQRMRENFEKNYGALRSSRPSGYETRLASLEREIVVTREQAAADANPARDAKGAWYWNPVDAQVDAAKVLASLSVADAAKPACYVEVSSQARSNGQRDSDGRYDMKGTIVSADAASGCREIVETNHAYFDDTRPRSSPQVLVVNRFGRCATLKDGAILLPQMQRFDTPPQGCYQHARMWNEVDWSKVAALVKP